MEYEYKNKSLDEMRMDFIFGRNKDVIVTDEIVRDISLKIDYENAVNNKEEFINALTKLTLLKSAHSKWPYEINKIQILEYVKKQLINTKAFEIAMLRSGLKNTNPIETVRVIEIYELLLEYLEKDKTITENNNENKSIQKSI